MGWMRTGAWTASANAKASCSARAKSDPTPSCTSYEHGAAAY